MYCKLYKFLNLLILIRDKITFKLNVNLNTVSHLNK